MPGKYEKYNFQLLSEFTPSDIRGFFQKSWLFKHLTIENVKMTGRCLMCMILFVQLLVFIYL